MIRLCLGCWRCPCLGHCGGALRGCPGMSLCSLLAGLLEWQAAYPDLWLLPVGVWGLRLAQLISCDSSGVSSVEAWAGQPLVAGVAVCWASCFSKRESLRRNVKFRVGE